MALSIEYVSPLSLSIGDRVNCHGAIVRLVTLNRRPCDIKGGIEVVSALAVLEDDSQPGSIPAAYWDSLEFMAMRGIDVSGLPAGRYWTVQGNAHARFARVIPSHSIIATGETVNDVDADNVARATQSALFQIEQGMSHGTAVARACALFPCNPSIVSAELQSMKDACQYDDGASRDND